MRLSRRRGRARLREQTQGGGNEGHLHIAARTRIVIIGLALIIGGPAQSIFSSSRSFRDQTGGPGVLRCTKCAPSSCLYGCSTGPHVIVVGIGLRGSGHRPSSLCSVSSGTSDTRPLCSCNACDPRSDGLSGVGQKDQSNQRRPASVTRIQSGHGGLAIREPTGRCGMVIEGASRHSTSCALPARPLLMIIRAAVHYAHTG